MRSSKTHNNSFQIEAHPCDIDDVWLFFSLFFFFFLFFFFIFPLQSRIVFIVSHKRFLYINDNGKRKMFAKYISLLLWYYHIPYPMHYAHLNWLAFHIVLCRFYYLLYVLLSLFLFFSFWIFAPLQMFVMKNFSETLFSV